ncbi:hypothetical protein LBMAG21_16210 [Armatimonadota bacterium]|nr:hypothetical protein LBMAG21_16210 [Armatimonadota bacterium]
METTTLNLRRATRASDGAGGKTESWANVATGLTARRRLYTQQSVARFEGKSGVGTEEEWLFVLYAKPFPEVRINDVLQDENGAEYLVKFVRGYPHTLQLDTRRMQ